MGKAGGEKSSVRFSGTGVQREEMVREKVEGIGRGQIP